MQDQVSMLKNQLDRKDKVVNTLLEKFKKKTSLRNFPFPSYNKWFICCSNFIHYSSYLCKNRENININQDSTIDNITKAQNITQAMTNTDVQPTCKENTKNISDIEDEGKISAKNLQNRTNQMKILNLRSTQS